MVSRQRPEAKLSLKTFRIIGDCEYSWGRFYSASIWKPGPAQSKILIVINVYRDIPMQDGIFNEGHKSLFSTVCTLMDSTWANSLALSVYSSVFRGKARMMMMCTGGKKAKWKAEKCSLLPTMLPLFIRRWVRPRQPTRGFEKHL